MVVQSPFTGQQHAGVVRLGQARPGSAAWQRRRRATHKAQGARPAYARWPYNYRPQSGAVAASGHRAPLQLLQPLGWKLRPPEAPLRCVWPSRLSVVVPQGVGPGMQFQVMG